MTQEKNIKKKTQCLIIGSGPAGYTAAIYASRANLNPILYSGLQPGGQLTTTTDVENFPGYPEGVQGPVMMKDLEEQARRMGTDLQWGTISKVDFSQRPFLAEVDEDYWVEAETVIISTGASAKWLGLPSEEKLSGYGVSACATCDGFFFKDKEVAIIGAGDTACEEALYLSKICSQVHMLVRRDEMRASKIMQDRVLSTPNIKVYWNSEAEEILGAKKVEGIRIVNNQTKEVTEMELSAVFVAIGHTPNTEIFKGQLQMDEEGYIITEPGTTQTNISGVFASGDVQDKIYRQAITAAGTGCMAAIEAERFLAMAESKATAETV